MKYHREFQVPKMAVLNLTGLFGGRGFLYLGGYLHFRYLIRLVKVGVVQMSPLLIDTLRGAAQSRLVILAAHAGNRFPGSNASSSKGAACYQGAT